MARQARVVVPGLPHHVTQRGNRRQPTFFADHDYQLYRTILADALARCAVEVWAYCLLPNHVHLILVPSDETGLARGVGEAHRRYTTAVNQREGWTGFLWQGRFASCPMDDDHLFAAARYIELNPVRAALAPTPYDWPWSSAAAHRDGQDDELVKVRPLLDRWPDWPQVLGQPLPPDFGAALHGRTRTGRPLGAPAFVAALEERLGRALAPRQGGRPRGQRREAGDN